MVDIPGGVGVIEYVKEAGEMVKRRAPNPLAAGLPKEEPEWSPLDVAMVPDSVRLELPACRVRRDELRRIGELVEQLGKRLVDLSHRHAMSERSIMFEAVNVVRATQYAIGPIKRAKRRAYREG